MDLYAIGGKTMNPRTDPRVAGQVARYHTWPTIRQQSLADHQWNVARIVFAICGRRTPPPSLIERALFHDIGEVETGDVPSYAKIDNPRLKDRLDEAERDAHMAMCLPWGVPAPGLMPAAFIAIIKLADNIDGWEFGLQEVLLGNAKFGGLIVQAFLERVIDWLSKLDGDLHENACRYIRRRSTEWDGGFVP
jgi:5'-deoxynucleotidase YfbR-like HD superfamily hydrolase